ncbi:MAG: polysaccharide deacetylase family protein [Firmicutes bacterium]|nr:polysaccharide deacetylase family protein [Bacillota bacterium]
MKHKHKFLLLCIGLMLCLGLYACEEPKVLTADDLTSYAWETTAAATSTAVETETSVVEPSKPAQTSVVSAEPTTAPENTVAVDPTTAVAQTSTVIIEEPTTAPAEPQEIIPTEEINTLIAEADILAKGYFYDEAISFLQASELKEEYFTEKIAEYEAQKAALVKYEGKAYHVFFHSLIIDTDLAFDNKGHSADGYNMWMTTVSEFKAMLPLFLENDFVLYDITWMSEIVDGKVQAKDIYLPEGKKPLIISIDDVNYYDYMKSDGFAQRLDVDADGRVCTIVKGNDGKEQITYDGDVMPILDSFVEEHPEFSFRGAKGIVALTGYQGAFGYRITDPDDYSKEVMDGFKAKTVEVATALRESGWQIACHSYTHNQYWNTKAITMKQIKYDISRWQSYIAEYVGKTNIIITPFGVSFSEDDERMQYLISEGFTIFCPVAANMNTKFYDGYMYQERLNLDGLTMLRYPERISKYLFDPALVVDEARPPMEK